MDRTKIQWFSEVEGKHSCTPLQVDLFHALWRMYHVTGVLIETKAGANTQSESRRNKL